jgi:hypothetical protein
VKGAVAIVCAVLAMSESACTIGPAGSTSDDSGSTGSSMTIGEQCDDVINAFCERLPGCGITLSIADCIANFMPQCCEGSACSQLSTVSESTVQACQQILATEDCSVVNDDTQNPLSCLQ